MNILSWGGKSVVGLLALGLLSPALHGASVTVTNNNSSMTVDPTTTTGMSSWKIDGNNILNQQSFFYRFGSGNNAGINTIGGPTVTLGNGTIDTFYSTGTFSLDILYTLRGGAPGSGTADIAEQITVQNLTGSALNNFHFYQFASFVGNGNVSLTQNGRGLYNEAYVDSQILSVNESVDTTLTPANEGETLANTLASITGIPNYTLSDNLSSTNLGLWAFEWDKNLAANGQQGSTVIFSKDLGAIIVPEPSTWALISVGLAVGGLEILRRRVGKKEQA